MTKDQTLLKLSGGLTTAALAEIEADINALLDSLYEVSTHMYNNPELAWEEHIAHDACTAYMEKAGWKVTRHAYGFDTAWEAVFERGTGGPVIGFNSEMDALRHVGHACGHNLIAIAGIAAAIGTANALTRANLPGKVILLGTPAEEAGGGKCYLVKKGAYDAMDLCMMTHPMGSGRAQGVPVMACASAFTCEYTGASAHAAAAPSKGVNALDAAVSAYMNIALLRQQIPDTHRIYCTLKGSESWSANVIPSAAAIQVGVRAPTAAESFALMKRMLATLRAGGDAHGCSYVIKREILYYDTQQSTALAAYHKDVCGEQWAQDSYVENLYSPGTTDFGDVTYKLPALHPVFELPDLAAGDFPHSNTYAKGTGLKSSAAAALRSATSIAALGVRAAADPEWMAQVRADWEKQMEACGGAQVTGELDAYMRQFPPGTMAQVKGCSCDL